MILCLILNDKRSSGQAPRIYLYNTYSKFKIDIPKGAKIDDVTGSPRIFSPYNTIIIIKYEFVNFEILIKETLKILSHCTMFYIIKTYFMDYLA